MADAASIIKSPRRLFKRLYEWTMSWARTKKAAYALFITAFVESSVFPIPPDVLLIPMVVSERKKWVKYTVVCVAGSVLGALLGYLIGWGFYESVGRRVVEFYSLQHSMDVMAARYSENAVLTVFTAAFTPIPFKVITIAAGLFGVPIPALVIGSLIGRSGRYFLIAGLVSIFGEKVSKFIEKNFDLFTLIFAACVIGGFIALRYLR